MAEWIPTTSRLPTPGQSVDWLTFRSLTVLDGTYLGSDFWETSDGTVVPSSHVTA